MSGVLHRLAAQAMGGGTVRSAARLPFLGAPGLIERHAPIYAPSEIPAATPRANEQSRPAPLISPDTVGVAERSPLHPQAVRGVEPPIGSENRLEVRAAPTIIAPLLPTPPQTEIKAPLVFDKHPQAMTDEAPSARDSSAEMPTPMTPRMRFPEPLLPPQSITPPAGSPRIAAAAEAAALSRSIRTDESGDVHVTIGRIELTAIHETPRTRTPASRQAPQVTLDDYLARRRGGCR
jgi:hypothetical protein